MRMLIVVMVVGVLFSPLALSEETLSDPAQEARARHLMHELACLVCEGQPISQSDAAVAVRMREEVRSLISAGQTDDGVRNWMRVQYGAGVLLRPPFDGSALLLWITPLLLLVTGVVVAMRLLGPQKVTLADEGTLTDDRSSNHVAED
jgi:cytochrome c-type biogenesis protein CcmH/NrfF